MADVSVVVPVYNGEKWLCECLESVQQQTFSGHLQLSVYDDGSTDGTSNLIRKWRQRLEPLGIEVVTGGHTDTQPRGVGHSKNMAVSQSTGDFLCFLDADDVMHCDRVSSQMEAAKAHPNAIIGSCFHRTPADSTRRFTRWANSLSSDQLPLQVFTSHGPTVIMPTWGVPEDLIFFYRHLELGGDVVRVDRDLLTYRYHPQATTFSVHEDTIWNLRVEFLQKQVLSHWSKFTIWNAGKQGRKLFRSLTPENQKKVCGFCDVDAKKISKGVYIYEESKERPKPRLPIMHFSTAIPPLIICVKQDLTSGSFEENLASLKLVEGTDYVHFN
ncbi:UDP-GlcNAc:betaGal beta-1,3-N-acetylglucosaminyltransferase-like protein 1 [Haliotis rubra]|uniref:UDP-GlcNAc:betaGal beta-1,3-N-acetylglucosaminyltransferase-like protein 1 n=1 Tax=Haliotis rubra TaxID=36100 RepID=UPI001EE5AD71|nr:UDP-GlcNAc:betaGal beta-1,3-N-acetylglucosaminyltransferase-like protein 1 [Haliotis rubra]